MNVERTEESEHLLGKLFASKDPESILALLPEGSSIALPVPLVFQSEVISR